MKNETNLRASLAALQRELEECKQARDEALRQMRDVTVSRTGADLVVHMSNYEYGEMMREQGRLEKELDEARRARDALTIQRSSLETWLKAFGEGRDSARASAKTWKRAAAHYRAKANHWFEQCGRVVAELRTAETDVIGRDYTDVTEAVGKELS